MLVTVYVVSVTVIVVATTTLTTSCTLLVAVSATLAVSAAGRGQYTPAQTVGVGKSGEPQAFPMHIVSDGLTEV